MKVNDYKFIIKAGNGKYNNLDKAYNNFIQKNVSSTNKETKLRFETYCLIMNELISMNELESFEEAKYRLTDGENPNHVMIDLIDKYKDDSHTLWFIRKRIVDYIDEDFYNLFCI